MSSGCFSRFAIVAIACLGAAAAQAAPQDGSPDPEVEEVERAVRQGLSPQGRVSEVSLRRQGADRLDGYALLELDDSQGAEVRYDCAAARQPEDAGQFDWRCEPMGPHADFVGRWTDTDDCNEVTVLAADGMFTAPNGGRGHWGVNGPRLALWGPGGTMSWSVALDADTLTLTSDIDGSVSRSTRC